jgi:hypothetical protein
VLSLGTSCSRTVRKGLPGVAVSSSFLGTEQESGLAEVHRLSDPRREFITDGDRSALRATWHNEAGYVVISLWRGNTCVATSHLTPKEAGRLATFITGGLADLAQSGMFSTSKVAAITPRIRWRNRFRQAVRSWRVSVGWSLEQIAQRLRTFE